MENVKNCYYFIYYNKYINKYCSVKYDNFYQAFRARQVWICDTTAKDFEEAAKNMVEHFNMKIENSHSAYEIWDNIQLQFAEKCCILNSENYAELMKLQKEKNESTIPIPSPFYDILE